MAAKKTKRKLAIRKKPTLRQNISAAQTKKPRRKLRAAGLSLWQRLTASLSKEHYLPLPDTSWGRFLNKRRHLVPSYFREAARELKQVTWPTRKETWKLTFAVFLFAIIFGLVIAVVDYGLDKVFRKVLLSS